MIQDIVYNRKRREPGQTTMKTLSKFRWIVIAALCVAVGLFLFGWLGSPKGIFAPGEDYEPPDGLKPESPEDQGGAAYAPDQLVGLFDDEEQAKECAKLYGIELVSFNYGVALFKVEGDPKAIIEKGLKNGWPELSLNNRFEAF